MVGWLLGWWPKFLALDKATAKVDEATANVVHVCMVGWFNWLVDLVG